MVNRKKSALLLIVVLSGLLMACSGNDKEGDTQKFIDKVKLETKPQVDPKAQQAIPVDDFSQKSSAQFTSLKERNPFTLAAPSVAAAAAGAASAANSPKLLGIFTVGVGSAAKKWAIISFNGKIHRVIAGQKVGNNLISEISDRSATVVSEENGEQQSYSLNLQEQKP